VFTRRFNLPSITSSTTSNTDFKMIKSRSIIQPFRYRIPRGRARRSDNSIIVSSPVSSMYVISGIHTRLVSDTTVLMHVRKGIHHVHAYSRYILLQHMSHLKAQAYLLYVYADLKLCYSTRFLGLGEVRPHLAIAYS
jgi:hypothetical protein